MWKSVVRSRAIYVQAGVREVHTEPAPYELEGDETRPVVVITVPGTATLSTRIVGEGGTGLVDALVRIRSGERVLCVGRTDEAGRVSLRCPSRISFDTWVEASCPGYARGSVKIQMLMYRNPREIVLPEALPIHVELRRSAVASPERDGVAELRHVPGINTQVLRVQANAMRLVLPDLGARSYFDLDVAMPGYNSVALRRIYAGDILTKPLAVRLSVTKNIDAIIVPALPSNLDWAGRVGIGANEIYRVHVVGGARVAIPKRPGRRVILVARSNGAVFLVNSPAAPGGIRFGRPPGRRITVEVRSGDGAPVPACDVYAGPADLGGLVPGAYRRLYMDAPVGATSEDGSLSLDLYSSTACALYAVSSGGLTGAATLDGGRETVEIVLERTSMLRGRLTTTAGDPVPGALVELRPLRQASGPALAALRLGAETSGIAKSDGTFALSRAGTALGILRVDANGFAPARVRVAGGSSEAFIEVVLQSAHGILVGIVVGANGMPIQGATVTAMGLVRISPRIVSDFARQTATDSVGVFRFGDLSGSSVASLLVTAPGFDPVQRDVAPAGRGDERIRISLRPRERQVVALKVPLVNGMAGAPVWDIRLSQPPSFLHEMRGRAGEVVDVALPRGLVWMHMSTRRTVPFRRALRVDAQTTTIQPAASALSVVRVSVTRPARLVGEELALEVGSPGCRSLRTSVGGDEVTFWAIQDSPLRVYMAMGEVPVYAKTIQVRGPETVLAIDIGRALLERD